MSRFKIYFEAVELDSNYFYARTEKLDEAQVKKTVEQLLPSWQDDEMLSGVVDYKHDDLEFVAVHSSEEQDYENIRLIDAREWKDGEWHFAY